jgi:hypothetical protein
MRVIIICLALMLAGCLDENTSQPLSRGAAAKLAFSAAGIRLDGMEATLTVSGVSDTYPMTLDVDGAASVSLPDLPDGTYVFTVTYSKSRITLARVAKSAAIAAGRTTTVDVEPVEVDRNFDDDFDGWVNIAELQWGSDPKLASSIPPGDDPAFALVALAGAAQSAHYALNATGGEAVNAGVSGSDDYAVSSGFTAYP